MFLKKITFYPLLLVFIFMTACASDGEKSTKPSQQSSTEVVNLYTDRYYEGDAKILDAFTQESGIAVNVVFESPEELLDRLAAEKMAPQADLVILSDLYYMTQVKEMGLLQPYSTDAIDEAVSSRNCDYDGHWVGLSKWIMSYGCAKDKINPRELSYLEMIAPKWKGELLLTKSSLPANQFLVASMLTLGNDQAILELVSRMVENTNGIFYNNDYEIIEALASGTGTLSLIKSGSLIQYRESGDPQKFKTGDKVGIIHPRNPDQQTFYNLTSAGLMKNCGNRANAVSLVEYLIRKDVQPLFCDVTFEYPVNVFVIPNEFLLSAGGFGEKTIDFSQAGKNLAKARLVMEKAGWK